MASKKTWRPVPDFKLYGRDSSYPEDSRHIRAIAGGAVLKIDYNFKRSMTVGLPDNIRLCELVEVDDPPTVPLDMPDSPGFWAFEGHQRYSGGRISPLLQDVVDVIDSVDGLRGFGKYIRGKLGDHLEGKWWKLSMPWNAQGKEVDDGESADVE